VFPLKATVRENGGEPVTVPEKVTGTASPIDAKDSTSKQTEPIVGDPKERIAHSWTTGHHNAGEPGNSIP
jgi:hypothetical protein